MANGARLGREEVRQHMLYNWATISAMLEVHMEMKAWPSPTTRRLSTPISASAAGCATAPKGLNTSTSAPAAIAGGGSGCQRVGAVCWWWTWAAKAT